MDRQILGRMLEMGMKRCGVGVGLKSEKNGGLAWKGP